MIMWFSSSFNSFNMDQLFGCNHHKNLWHLWYQILSSFSFSFSLFKVLLFLELIPYNFCLFVMFIHMCLLCVVLWSTTNYNSHSSHLFTKGYCAFDLIACISQWSWMVLIGDYWRQATSHHQLATFYNDYRLEFSKCMQQID